MNSSKLFDLTGQTAIVTGSSRGLGKAMARGLAEAGASVVICSNDLDEAQTTAEEFIKTGLKAWATFVDTSDKASCQKLIEDTVKTFGELNILVCNAGVDVIKSAEDYEEKDWDYIMDINLKGYFNCAQLAGRQFIKQDSGGSIILNASIAATSGIPMLAPYSASKGGVLALAKSLAVEWASRNIRVNCISPGYFENIMSNAKSVHEDPKQDERIDTFTPLGRRGQLNELVGPVVFLASDASSYVTGLNLTVDGGYDAC